MDIKQINKNKMIIYGKQYEYNIISLFIFSFLTILYLLIEIYIYKKTINDLYKIINGNSSQNQQIIFSENLGNHSSFYKPFLPKNENEIIKKNYFKTPYNNSNVRYHFVEDFKKRKIFKINYSYLPYNNIDKTKSYEENADDIYKSTGMLNITKLDKAFYNKIIKDNSEQNHIHLSMGHDSNYILLSLISIASILNTTNSETFIHFHLVLLGAKFEDMKPIIALNKINPNVEFIFYDGKQVEYDFFEFGSKERRGLGDYTKFLIPEIVNNTNRILILDSADIIAKKDLSELYYYDIGDNYFAIALDIFAGKIHKVFPFTKNKFYPNIGSCLVNVRLFRRDNLYMAGYFVRFAYDYLPCPTQEMFFFISQYKIKYFPLEYNCPEFFHNEEEIINKKYDNSLIKFYMQGQQNSHLKYNLDEIIKADSNSVLQHLFYTKPFLSATNPKNGKTWINYVKLANVYEKIKLKFPNAVEKYDK